MPDYVGIFKLIATTRWWVTLGVLLAVGWAIPFVIADRGTKLFYNFSYSGMIGDLCLLIVICIGITMLQRGEALPIWFSGGVTQILWLIICIGMGAYLGSADTPWPIESPADRYHNMITVPVFMFLLPLMILAIKHGGDEVEWPTVWVLVLVWAALGVYDGATNRLNQPKRLSRMFGVVLVDGKYENPHLHD